MINQEDDCRIRIVYLVLLYQYEPVVSSEFVQLGVKPNLLPVEIFLLSRESRVLLLRILNLDHGGSDSEDAQRRDKATFFSSSLY